MTPGVLHLHTYFLFPFGIDKEIVSRGHGEECGHFARLFFNPDHGSPTLHYVAMVAVTLLALGALTFGAYLIVAHPTDYRDILLPLRKKTRRGFRWHRLKKST